MAHAKTCPRCGIGRVAHERALTYHDEYSCLVCGEYTYVDKPPRERTFEKGERFYGSSADEIEQMMSQGEHAP